MTRSYTFVATLLLFSFLGIISCQKDNFTEPEITPNNYIFNIPNTIRFEFSQISQNRISIIPYTNRLSIKNNSNTTLSGDYTLFVFKSNEKNYGNLAFIKKSDFSNIETNASLNDISLEETATLFSDENTIVSILNLNNTTTNHSFGGLYIGELNIFTATDTTFVKSVTCIGIIDITGRFNIFSQNEDENNIVHLKGVFNSDNLISGSILKRDNTLFSPISNIDSETLQLDNNNLTGNTKFSDNNQEHLLNFNLTKQN